VPEGVSFGEQFEFKSTTSCHQAAGILSSRYSDYRVYIQLLAPHWL